MEQLMNDEIKLYFCIREET